MCFALRRALFGILALASPGRTRAGALLGPVAGVGGVNDVLMLVCDGLKGLPDAVETVWHP